MNFIYSLIAGLITASTTVAGRILLSLGIGIVTVTGTSVSLDWAIAYVSNHWTGLPAISMQLLGALRVGTDIGIVVGAILAKMSLNFLSTDSISKFVMKGRTGSSAPMLY